jgi:predicted nucleic acid-binding Zn ribbon protein
VLERLLSLARVYPFRCEECGHRFKAVVRDHKTD